MCFWPLSFLCNFWVIMIMPPMIMIMPPMIMIIMMNITIMMIKMFRSVVVSLAFLYNFWVIIYRTAFDEITSSTVIIWWRSISSSALHRNCLFLANTKVFWSDTTCISSKGFLLTIWVTRYTWWTSSFISGQVFAYCAQLDHVEINHGENNEGGDYVVKVASFGHWQWIKKWRR